MIGRDDYQARRAARVERLERQAARAAATSAAALGAARRIGDGIPFGQPILVGHHSEGRARRDAQKIHDNMRKGVEAGAEAERLTRAASAAEESTAISSDDPEALQKLRWKVRDLEAAIATMKKANQLIRKGATVESLMNDLSWSMKTAQTVLRPDPLGCIGFPAYALANRGAEVRRCKKRIAELEVRSAVAEERREQTIGDVTIAWADNRIQIAFPGKPSEVVRAVLKQAGFRWAPSVGVWQRMANENAWRIAIRAAEGNFT